MSAYLVWLILALVLLGFEMMLGTIYLLAFVAGAFASCFVSVIGFDFTAQCITGALVIILGVLAALKFRRKIRKNLTPNQECDDLDQGQQVFVDEVLDDGSAKVNYRGTVWRAYPREGKLEKGNYTIDKIQGTRLIIFK